MRISRPFLFASLAIAGATAVCAAEQQTVHVMTVRLPGGGIEHIRYTGDAAPVVLVAAAAPAPAAAAATTPPSLFDIAFGAASPFAQMDALAAMMDARADAMMRQAALAAQPQPGAVQAAALADAPAGIRYSSVSTTIVNGKACTTSMSMTAAGAGKAPAMLRRVSGDCAAAGGLPAAPLLTAVPAAPAPVARQAPAPAPARAAVAPDSI